MGDAKGLKVTLWGTRGSYGVSGAGFVRHGGATTCVEVEAHGAPPVIVDGGTGVAALGRSKAAALREAIVYQTHMHWDHVQGYPFFAPLFDPLSSLTFRAVPRDGRSLGDVLDEQMTQPTFPIGLNQLPARLRFEDLDLKGEERHGALEVGWTELCHPSGSTGYRFEAHGASLVFTGDVEVRQGCMERLIDFSRGADVLVMDAQYFPEEYGPRVGFGHSTPLDAVEVALRAGVGRLIMTHHDPTHDDERLDAKLALAREAARGEGLVVDNGRDGMVIELGARARMELDVALESARI